jgi:transcriptional regulator with XRE-family HTH domain
MTHSMTTQATETPFPALLKAFRATYGLTQQQVATRLEIARNTVKSWERGDPRRQPHILTREGVVARLTVYERELQSSPVANSPSPQ